MSGKLVQNAETLITVPKFQQDSQLDISFFGFPNSQHANETPVKPRILLSEKGLNFIQDQERSLVEKLQRESELKAAKQLSYQLAKDEAERLRTESFQNYQQQQRRKAITTRTNTISRQNSKAPQDPKLLLDSSPASHQDFRHKLERNSTLPTEQPMSPPTLRNVLRDKEYSQKSSFPSHVRQIVPTQVENSSIRAFAVRAVPESTKFSKFAHNQLGGVHAGGSPYKIAPSQSVDALKEFKLTVSVEMRHLSPPNGRVSDHHLSDQTSNHHVQASMLYRRMQNFSQLISDEDKQRSVHNRLLKVLGAQPTSAPQEAVNKQLE